MVIVQLLGGLGNQLFQYAAARRLAYERGLPLKLDMSAFQSYTLRTPKLHHFNISAEVASSDEIQRFIKPGIFGKGTRWISRNLIPVSHRHIYRESRLYHFDQEFLRLPDDVYLQGYFQSELYFIPIEDVIRRDLTVITPPSDINQAMMQKIASTDAVSLHVRRGDYANDPKTKAYHGVLSLDYYREAIKLAAESVVTPHFFMFSDDVSWLREQFDLNYPHTLIDHNDSDHDYEDLRLMSLCKHHIIANSSFSWWGAWLCQCPGKKVYAPNRWLTDTTISTEELIPMEWTKVPC